MIRFKSMFWWTMSSSVYHVNILTKLNVFKLWSCEGVLESFPITSRDLRNYFTFINSLTNMTYLDEILFCLFFVNDIV